MTTTPQAQDKVAGLIERLRGHVSSRMDETGRPGVTNGAWDMMVQAAAALAAQQAEIARLRNDSSRLDWLQAQTKGYGNGWIVRDSESGRGMRVHETSREEARATIREAIDAARAALAEPGS